MLTYSNPRTKVIVEDWPIGGGNRGTAIFSIEANRKGQRATRTTENKKGGWCKPKLGTYSPITRIVDGSDGRTYIASLTEYGHVSIMQSNMQYSQESIHESDPRYTELVELLKNSPIAEFSPA